MPRTNKRDKSTLNDSNHSMRDARLGESKSKDVIKSDDVNTEHHIEVNSDVLNVTPKAEIITNNISNNIGDKSLDGVSSIDMIGIFNDDFNLQSLDSSLDAFILSSIASTSSDKGGPNPLMTQRE